MVKFQFMSLFASATQAKQVTRSTVRSFCELTGAKGCIDIKNREEGSC